MENIPFTPIRKIFEAANKKEAAGEDIIHLELGRPDFDTPDHIKTAAAKALTEGKVHYTSNYGIPELRTAITRKFKTDNALDYDPAGEIIVTVGVTEGILMCMMSLLNPGEEVLIPSPAFPCYTRCAFMAGATPVDVPLTEENNFTPTAELFRSRITDKTRLIAINTPNNPTGAIFGEDVLAELAQLAIERDLIVISDEIYEKQIYNGQKHFSIAALPGMKERTITLNGFSKSHSMTGWRLGYLGASHELVSLLIRIRQYATVCPTSFAQWGAVAALEGSQQCVADMVAEFDRRRRMVVARLHRIPGISFVEPLGAFYVFVNITKLGLPATELAYSLLDEARIALVPWGTDHVRISLDITKKI
jgi:aspartate/methionine/tyrosine aminotransferase